MTKLFLRYICLGSSQVVETLNDKSYIQVSCLAILSLSNIGNWKAECGEMILVGEVQRKKLQKRSLKKIQALMKVKPLPP